MTSQQPVFGATQAVREVVVASSRMGKHFLCPDEWPKCGTSTEDLALVHNANCDCCAASLIFSSFALVRVRLLQKA